MIQRKVIIACQGEIALRLIRAAKHLGILPVALCTQGEALPSFALYSEEIYWSSSPNPYADQDAVLAAAAATGAILVAPGYGPLAENSAFASACESSGLKFIGPTATSIELAGDKRRARRVAADHGIPVVPGGNVESLIDLQECAAQLGFPLLLKAALGGGGRGIRLVENASRLREAWDEVDREARVAFGSSAVYVERYLGTAVRHIEVQVIGDQFGNVVAVGDRECSVQRRRQKIVEEAPAPGLSKRLRQQLHSAAVSFARALEYVGAGTVEFLVLSPTEYYFIEMNARLQVEHPITEETSGVDLAAEMFRVAMGEHTQLTQPKIYAPRGVSIEFRICAEDPYTDFLPTSGSIDYVRFPGGPGVRVDSALEQGFSLSAKFDSLCAKIIVTGATRTAALARAKVALNELIIAGVQTNVPFHYWLLNEETFVSGRYNLDISSKFPAKRQSDANDVVVGALAAVSIVCEHVSSENVHSLRKNSEGSSWQEVNHECRSYGR